MRLRVIGVLVAVVASAYVTSVAMAGEVPGYVRWTCNGAQVCPQDWVTSPVLIDWTVDPLASGNCPDVTIKDDPGRTVTCEVSRDAIVKVPITIKLDQKAPTVSVTPDRPPDHDGWYTRPVGFSVTATDETSGVKGCDPLAYAGPDAGTATITATCRDLAGNVGSRGYQLSYDATPPDPNAATISTGDRLVRLSWPAGPTASVTRTPGINGKAGSVIYAGAGSGFTDRKVRNREKYRYVLTLTDQAGNTSSREITAKPNRKLLGPEHRATLNAPPLLTWTPVRDARYYNVQLFRNGRKILSAWPAPASLQLKRKWHFHGKRYRLKPAKYHWHVWPGDGRRSANRYGDQIGGGRSFTIVAARP